MILLLSGWSSSGKDAVASLLVKLYGFQRLAFADPLKEMVAEEFGVPMAQLHDEEKKRTHRVIIGSEEKTLREVLIQRGQEIRQEHGDPGFFARAIANQILERRDEASQRNVGIDFVIPDWRLPIERETLLETLPGMEIVTARVQRQGQENSPVGDSQTEHQLDSQPFEVILENNGKSMTLLQQEIVKKLSPWLV